jgi:hypothetical protein
MKDNPEAKTPAEQLLQLLLSKEKFDTNYLCYTERQDLFTIVSILKNNEPPLAHSSTDQDCPCN